MFGDDCKSLPAGTGEIASVRLCRTVDLIVHLPQAKAPPVQLNISHSGMQEHLVICVSHCGMQEDLLIYVSHSGMQEHLLICVSHSGMQEDLLIYVRSFWHADLVICVSHSGMQ